MSNVNENDRDPQSRYEPPAPMPRGGGDISGKGISGPSDEEGGGVEEAAGEEAGTTSSA